MRRSFLGKINYNRRLRAQKWEAMRSLYGLFCYLRLCKKQHAVIATAMSALAASSNA